MTHNYRICRPLVVIEIFMELIQLIIFVELSLANVSLI